MRQRFAFSEVYTIPGIEQRYRRILTKGWVISGLGVIQSGTPYWVYNTNSFLAPINPGDYNMDGTDWDVPDTPSTKFHRITQQAGLHQLGYLPRADFPAPAPGTEGNLKRNIYRNPGFIEFDASVVEEHPQCRSSAKRAISSCGSISSICSIT